MSDNETESETQAATAAVNAGQREIRIAHVSILGNPYTIWEIPGAHIGPPQFLVHDGVEARDVVSMDEDGTFFASMNDMNGEYRRSIARIIREAFPDDFAFP